MKAHRWVVALLVLFAPLEAAARTKDPRVPPGSDPGGVAVAIVSSGIDYTLPRIAARLARDGEAEIIGWDFVDGDGLPFEASQDWSAAEPAGYGSALAETVLAASPRARLVPVRIDPGQAGSVVRSLAFVGQTPARVVLIANGGSAEQDQELFRQAAQHFRQLLIVLPANATQQSIGDAVAALDNVLIMPLPSVGHGDRIGPSATDGIQLPPALAIAAQAAGIAAEAASAAPRLDGAGLKQAALERLAKLGVMTVRRPP